MIYALRDSDGLRIHILDANREENFSCKNCNDRLVPNQGIVKPWYFSHAENSDCIIGEMRGKGCIFQLSDNQNRECKAKEECEQECPFKNG